MHLDHKMKYAKLSVDAEPGECSCSTEWVNQDGFKVKEWACRLRGWRWMSPSIPQFYYSGADVWDQDDSKTYHFDKDSTTLWQIQQQLSKNPQIQPLLVLNLTALQHRNIWILLCISCVPLWKSHLVHFKASISTTGGFFCTSKFEF